MDFSRVTPTRIHTFKISKSVRHVPTTGVSPVEDIQRSLAIRALPKDLVNRILLQMNKLTRHVVSTTRSQELVAPAAVGIAR